MLIILSLLSENWTPLDATAKDYLDDTVDFEDTTATDTVGSDWCPPDTGHGEAQTCQYSPEPIDIYKSYFKWILIIINI